MRTIKGKIDLINMSEITEATSLFTWIKYADDINGNGISSNPQGKKYIGIAYNKSSSLASNNPLDYTWSLFQGESGTKLLETKNYYAYSDNGENPPMDPAILSVSEDGLLVFGNEDISFTVNDKVLSVEDIFSLNIFDDELSGSGSEWTEKIPAVPPGNYLWVKTVYVYSDGTSSIQYLSSYQGKNGEQGPMGERGEDANQFELRLSQTEILKFSDSNKKISVSPATLKATVIKNDLFSADGYTQIYDLDISKISIRVYNIYTGQWLSFKTENLVTIDEAFNFNINLALIINQGENKLDAASILFLNDECILEISYVHTEIDQQGQIKTYNLISYPTVRYGMSRDMATLSVKAEGIVASMQDSKLYFNASGLTVKNGCFVICDNNMNNLLYADENGNLSLKGNVYAEGGYFRGELRAATGSFSGELVAASGTFKGTLEAAEGSFKGDITAASGKIGGFEIGETQLLSTNLNENQVPSIVLDGANGKIIAENIELGTGAYIKEYIKLGDNAYIKNPTLVDSTFIKVLKDEKEILTIDTDGIMKIGSDSDKITIDGARGVIESNNYKDGLGWKLSNTESIFNDVTVRGSIGASVLKYGEVQAIGGALLVRPSSRIVFAEEIEELNELSQNTEQLNLRLILESAAGFIEDEYCRIDGELSSTGISHSFYKVLKIIKEEDSIEQKEIIVSLLEGNTPISPNKMIGKSIVHFGKEGSVGLALNGSIDNSFTPPAALTVFDFSLAETSTEEAVTISEVEATVAKKVVGRVIPRIVLGYLPSETQYGYAGGTYGLYAENVLLQGELVTNSLRTNISSGISTLYRDDHANSANTDAGQLFGDKAGEILLWAGAPGYTPTDIEKAPFFVDKNGNLFASSGYFKGTIITEAKITASEIETAVLRGHVREDGNETPALTISDAAKGIVFTATENNDTKKIFELNKDSIVANVETFSFNDTFKITREGSLVVPKICYNTNSTNAIIIDQQAITFTDNFNNVSMSGSARNQINFGDGISFLANGASSMTINQQNVEISKSLTLNESVWYKGKVEYKPASSNGVLVGYDIFVYE